MRKLLFTTVALATTFAMAEITSSNIVGYSTTTLAGKKYAATGTCFASVGSTKFTLANVTPTAYDWESDYVFVMNPDDSSAEAMLIYLDASTAAAYGMDAGWYDAESLDPYNDVEWSFGTGFMTSFDSGLPNFQYAGEVVNTATSVDCRGKKYSIVPNLLPRTAKLGEITASGYDWEADYLFIMNPDDSSADAMLIYLDAETAAGYGMTAGWYDAESLDSYQDYEIPAGAGVMTSFDGGNVILNFPAPIAAAN